MLPRVRNTDWPTCECGCGEPVPAAKATESRRNIKKGQPLRFVNGHCGGPKPADWNDIVVTDTGCHIFGSYAYPKQGYRRVRWKGESVPMHFMVWEREHGDVPDGHLVHHRCENKKCVNLAHLELMERGAHTVHHLKGKTWPEIRRNAA